jgi:hypothetical protein
MCDEYFVDAPQSQHDSLKSRDANRFTERLLYKGLAPAFWNDNCMYRRSSNARSRTQIEVRPRVRSVITTLFAGGFVVYVQQMFCR